MNAGENQHPAEVLDHAFDFLDTSSFARDDAEHFIYDHFHDPAWKGLLKWAAYLGWFALAMYPAYQMGGRVCAAGAYLSFWFAVGYGIFWLTVNGMRTDRMLEICQALISCSAKLKRTETLLKESHTKTLQLERKLFDINEQTNVS